MEIGAHLVQKVVNMTDPVIHYAEYVLREAASVSDYGVSHRPPGPHYGTPLHDLVHDARGEELLPEDVYTHPQWYDIEPRVNRLMRKYRGQPEAMVDMYRSLPHGHTHFNTGDWVALHPDIARSENMDPEDPDKDLPVIHTRVPAKHLWQNGDSFNEWGYWGPRIQGEVINAPEWRAQ